MYADIKKAIYCVWKKTIRFQMDLFIIEQGCQMEYFQTKSNNLGKFWRDLQWKMMVYLLSI
jgi:hypothetical protein